MGFFVCKSCGRGIIADSQPAFCYADRMDSIENISDEDAKKMLLFRVPVPIDSSSNYVPEFPGDQRWDPFTGDSIEAPDNGFTLSALQDKIMEGVRK